MLQRALNYRTLEVSFRIDSYDSKQQILRKMLPNAENDLKKFAKKMSRKHCRMVLSCKWYCPAEWYCPVTVNDENKRNPRCLVNGQAPASKWTA
jgi:hypothetical protein